MDEKQLQFLFDNYAKGKGFADLNEFRSLMDDSSSRKVFFDESNKELGFADYNDFENTLGVKKKGQTSSNVAPTPSEAGLSNGQADGEIPIVSLEPQVSPDERMPDGTKHPFDLAADYVSLKDKTKIEGTGDSEMEVADEGNFIRPKGEDGKHEKSFYQVGGRKQAEDLKEFLKIQHGIEDPENLHEENKDFPQNASDWKFTDESGVEVQPYSKDNRLKLRETNPTAYYDKINGVKTQYAIAEKTGNWSLANEFIKLKKSAQNVDEFVGNVNKQKEIINTVFDDKDEREKANERLKSEAYVISPAAKGFTESYKNSGLSDKLSPYEYSGLLTLKAFEPEKYEQTVNFINTPITEKYSHQLPTEALRNMQAPVSVGTSFESPQKNINGSAGKLSQQTVDEKLGLETRMRELSDIGQSNYFQSIQKDNAELNEEINKLDDSDGNKALLINKYNSNVNDLNKAIAESENDDAKYPLTTALKFDKQVADMTQQEPGLLNTAAIKFALQTDKPRKAFENIFGDSPSLQMQRVGEEESNSKFTYLPEEYIRQNSPVIPVYPKELEKEIKAISANKEMPFQERQAKIKELLIANQSKIKTITNPNEGKSKNFFSKATAYTMADFMGNIGGMAFTMAALPIKGLPKEMVGMGLLFHNDHYTEAVKKGIPNPNEYANLHSGIDMLAGSFGTQYQTVKKLISTNPSTKNILNGITEEMWDKVVSKDKAFISKISNAAKSSLKDNTKMVAMWGGAVPAFHNVANNAFGNENKSASDILNESVASMKEMAVGQLPLAVAGVYSGYKRESTLRKSLLWDIGDNADIELQRVKDLEATGKLTPEKATQRTQTIKEVSKLIDLVPSTDKKGKPLNDEARMDYLYNLYVKNKVKTESGLPEKQKVEAEKTGMVADHINNEILDPSTDKQLESRLNQIEKELEPEVGADGKTTPIPEKEKTKLEAEKEAINQVIEERKQPEPVKEPSTVSKITADAEDLLKSVDSGSKPAFVTKNMERIAKENGIEVTDKTTPDEIINQLKSKQESKPSTVSSEAPSPKGNTSNVGGDVETQYSERKKSIEDKLNQQLEDNKDRLDDIEDKGGTKTVRQKIYQEHTNEMVELEKWKMKEDLKNEKSDKGNSGLTENKDRENVGFVSAKKDYKKANEISDKIKSLRSADGSISEENMPEYRRLRKEYDALEQENNIDRNKRVERQPVKWAIDSFRDSNHTIGGLDEVYALKKSLKKDGYTDSEIDYIIGDIVGNKSDLGGKSVAKRFDEINAKRKTTPKGNTSNVGGGSGGVVDVDFAKRKKEMQTEYDKLQKERFALAKERDEIIGGGEKYRTWGKKQTDEKINEIRDKQKQIDEKQTELRKELKVIEAKEKGSVELFDHYNSGTGSPNTIIYDIENNKLLERENVVRGKTKEISIEDAARNKFASTLRGRNEREINEAYTDKVKAKYEAEITDEIAKYKSEQSLKETTKQENKPLTSEQDNKAGTESVEPIPTETQGEPEAEPIEAGGSAEPPKEPPLADFAYKGTKKERQRALLTHLMEAKEVPEHYKKSLEKKGLDYNAASREEAADAAKGIVDNLGVDNALEAARSELVHPSVGSAIYADVLNKLYAEEKTARASGDTKTADNLAQQWADVSLEYAAASTGKGQFISQIAHFYKTSPMGIIMRDKANKAERFKEWFENKEEGYKEVFDEIVKSEEGQALLKVEVEKLRKEERKSERAAKKEEVFKKVDDAVKKWTDKLTPKTMRGNDFKKQGAGAEEVLKVLGSAVKKAYEIGETIEKIIEDAKVYLKDKFDVTDKDVEAIVNDFIGGRKNKKKGTTESEKAHIKRIEYLEKELKRLEERRSKEPAEKKPSTREIPNDEQQLRDAIEAERGKWDNEKDAARQLANDYQKMETERNRQLKRVGELNDAIKILESGKLPEGQTKEAKKDTPEIEALKKEKESLEKSVRENIAHEKKMKGLETELQRLIDRKPREEKATDKAEISPEEKTIRDKIKSEREAWDKENSRETRINNLEAELQRLKDRKAKDTNAAKKPEYDAEETRLRNEVKSEREAWQHDKVMEGLETELQRLKDRKAKETKPESKRIISEDERLKRDEIEAEQKAWDVENNIDKLNTELQRVRNRQKKVTNPKEKKELTDTEKNIIQEIKDEKEVWAKEVEPERKLREALKATQKSLEEYERRVRERDISKTPTNGAPETPELKALRDKRDAKKKEYDEMKKKITGENDRIESLKERAEELKTRMDNKDFSAEAYEEKAPLSEREKQALDEYKEVKKQYDEAKKKSPEYIDKKAKLYIENFRKKLKGLNEKEKEDVIRKSIKKLIDNGALKYEDFKKIIAETIGIKEFTDEQVKQIEDLTAVINKVNEVENAMVANPTRENISAYEQAQKTNLQAQLDLYNITNTRSDVVGTLKAIYTGGLLGLPTLIKNVGQNVIAQWTLRLPKAIVVQLGDFGAYGIAKLKSKWIGGEAPALPNNLLLAQKGYFGNLVKGLKSAAFDFNKGVVRKDYFASTEYQSTLSPRRALKELGLWRKGELHLTKTEIADRLLKTTLGWQSDFILRGMQFGDTPQRHAAEGARAIQIAMQELGLKDSLEIEAFLQSPEKYANKIFLKQGKNAKEAGELATEVRESIIKEGEKAVFQEDNFLSKGSEFLEKSLRANKDDSPATAAVKNAASLAKTKTFPFIKIPANVMWAYFKAANPYLAFGLAAKDAATAKYYQKKGETAKARAYEDKSASNMAHGIVGLGLAAVANGWIQSGYVRTSNDEKNRARETEGEKIFGKQNQLNLGKVLGSDSDYWVDLSWFGPLGTILDTKARMGEEKARKKDKGEEQQGAWDDFVDNMSYSAAASLNTLVFDQASKAVDAITGDKKQRQQYISESIGSVENMVTGATIPSISKAILPNEVRVKGDGIWETVKNDAKYRNGIIRFFAGQPPAKVSIWGEPIKKDNSITGALGNMLGFQKGNDEVFGLILYDDYQRTQNTKFFPVPEDEKITVNGKEFKLTQQETDKLKEYVGKSRKMLVEPFVYDNATTGSLSDIYSSLNDTEKVKQLNKLYQMGKKIGYHNFIQEFPQYSGIDLPEE